MRTMTELMKNMLITFYVIMLSNSESEHDEEEDVFDENPSPFVES